MAQALSHHLGRLWTARRPRLRVAAFALVACAVFVVAAAPVRRVASRGLSAVVLWASTPFAPSISGFGRLPERSRVLAADGSVLAELTGTEGRELVTLRDLPDHVVHAVLAAEDADFYHHGGVDPMAVFRALVRNASGGRQGGSTITQQLAKINYVGARRTVARKYREVLYAARLERTCTKDELLERYVNQVYFGDGAYGIGTAAQRYFGVDASALDPAQAATLAGVIRSPEGLDPRRHANLARDRRDQVLANMHSHGWLTKTQYDEAVATPVTVVPPPPAAPGGLAPHFVAYVRREAATLDALGPTPEARVRALYTGGYTVQTTLDPAAFSSAGTAVQQRLGLPGDPAAAVASVVPGDGAITLLFGGLDESREFDLATQGRRQPGSSFKPFVYLAALREGIDPRSTLPSSSPMDFEYRGEHFTVQNYEGEGGGPMTVDDALVHSVNVVFMQLGLAVGPDRVVAAAGDAGIRPPGMPGAARRDELDALPSIALGGLQHGVSPLEMAAAYATFAARGTYATPYAIRRITDARDHEVYEHTVELRQAFDRKEVGVLTATLERVVSEGTGRAAAIGRPVAGKTGTSQDYGDAWFAGYVPQRATAVWVGDPDARRPMTNVHGRKVAGGTYPAELFSDVMRSMLADVPVQPLETASPDDLHLRPLQSTTTSSTSTSSTTPGSSTSSTVPGELLPGETLAPYDTMLSPYDAGAGFGALPTVARDGGGATQDGPVGPTTTVRAPVTSAAASPGVVEGPPTTPPLPRAATTTSAPPATVAAAPTTVPPSTTRAAVTTTAAPTTTIAPTTTAAPTTVAPTTVAPTAMAASTALAPTTTAAATAA